jgi:hypothetical protein
MAGLDAAALETLMAHFAQTIPPLHVIVFQQLGNTANRGPAATAFGPRDTRYNLNFIVQWTDREEAARHIQWIRALWEALVPYGTGGIYVTNVGHAAEADPAVMRAAYGANYERLVALKHQHDPTNFFRYNQNGAHDG